MEFGGADLHCHSNVSDGVEPPAALVARALEAKLSVLALSDHDNLHGIPAFEEAARGTGLVTVAGTELSTRLDGEDVHLLGLFVDPSEPELQGALARMRRDRDKRGELMVEKLAAVGIPLDVAEIRKVVGDGAFGRPHIARAMMAAGHVKTFEEAFDRYLTKGKPGWVPKTKWTLPEAIAAVRKAGGLAVVAHPVWYDDPEKVVAVATKSGADGLEVIHSDQDVADETTFGKMAQKHGLLRSAGSDYHGPPEGRKAVGGCRLDEEAWKLLVAAAKKRREESRRAPLHLAPR